MSASKLLMHKLESGYHIRLNNKIHKGALQVKNSLRAKKRPTKHAPDTGALRVRKSQAVSYALPFFWLDGFAVPAPAQVTQTVGWLTSKKHYEKITHIHSSSHPSCVM